MKKLLILFSLITKQYLKNPVFFALIALLPISAFVLSHSDTANHSLELNIGIYCAAPDALTDSVFSSLESAGGIAHFVSYDDPDRMTMDILCDTIECGYIFKPDLAEKLRGNKYNGAVSLLCGTNSDIAASLGNEIIFSAVLRCYTPGFINNFITKNTLLSPYSDILSEGIIETLKLYESDGSTYHVEFSVLGDGNTIADTTEMSDTSLLFPVRGTLYILVFAAGLFGSLQFLHEKTTGLFRTMPRYCSFCAGFLYPLSIGLIVGLMAMITLLFSGLETFSLLLLARMAAYVIFIAIYCGLLTLVLPSEMIFAGAILVFLIICFVACPVFINLKPFVPGIEFVRHLFPPGYFLLG